MLCFTHLSAQSLKGKITDTNGKPLDASNIMLIDNKNNTIAYTFSGSSGYFSISYKSESNPVSLVVSLVGYEKQLLPFNGLNNDCIIKLREKQYQLKEVKITAQRIRQSNDTLTYSVAGFKQKQDRSIADVIAKMPGMDVKEDGHIEFQGKAINKFYIEGMDLMGSKYSQASENLAANKVVSVQVLQNHQPIKALRGVSFSEQAALNIILTDNAKGAWAGSLDLGTGTTIDKSKKLLYDCRLMEMFFGKKMQDLSMYKNNNTGKDINKEVIDITDYFRSIHEEKGILAPLSNSVSAIDKDRYTYNDSHVWATNLLLKTALDCDLRFQLDVLYNKIKQHTSMQTQYLDLDGLPIVTEDSKINNIENQWKSEILYKVNSDKFYLQNRLKGYIDFDKSDGSIIYNNNQKDLFVKPRKRFLTEDFQLLKNLKHGNSIDISSLTTYNYLPGQLLTINGKMEELNLNFLASSNYVNFKQKVGKFYIDNKIGADFYNQKMRVNYSDEITDNTYKLFTLYANPCMSIMRNKYKLTFSSKISYAHQYYNQKSCNSFWIEPSLDWNYTMNAVSSFYFQYSLQEQPQMGKEIYDTPIFSSYRTKISNNGQFETHTINQIYASYKYSQPINGIFINCNSSIHFGTNNVLYKSTLSDDVYCSTATNNRYATSNYTLDGSFSKAFGWAKAVFSLDAIYSWNNYKVLIDGLINSAQMQNGVWSFHYSLRPIQLFSIEGRSSLILSKSVNKDNPLFSSGTIKYYTHKLNFNIFPFDKWQLTLKNEFYHSTEKSIKNNYFCDAALSYSPKRCELQLMFNNIWGNDKYEQRYLSNSVQNYTTCQLRPREIIFKVSFDL
jgi:hypothetical protein